MIGSPMTPCADCGMPCKPNDYHPYAACLMFKACQNSETVRANLEAIRAPYLELIMAVASKHPGEDRHATALRYIRQAEDHSGVRAAAAITSQEPHR